MITIFLPLEKINLHDLFAQIDSVSTFYKFTSNKEGCKMPDRKKTGMAYLICGIIILVLSIIFDLGGWRDWAGIIIGALLAIAGLLLTSKKA